MLIFEDDAAPAGRLVAGLMPPGMLGLQSFSYSLPAAALSGMPGASAHSREVPREAPLIAERRVNAADKRIINGSTDVNQLVPFKYKWAWQKYLDSCANHWMPQEINMNRDIALWKDPKGLSEDDIVGRKAVCSDKKTEIGRAHV